MSLSTSSIINNCLDRYTYQIQHIKMRRLIQGIKLLPKIIQSHLSHNIMRRTLSCVHPKFSQERFIME
ncbi:unnamed protein product [Moneuplotes crassus]|uniref:Uncharacterized protein n=1 Tax=Euplotes crassus TaxID=5936 RepID=A0AAD2CWU5_EUPCR|nr:unnamed protein product [Moneuplotes crassus]